MVKTAFVVKKGPFPTQSCERIIYHHRLKHTLIEFDDFPPFYGFSTARIEDLEVKCNKVSIFMHRTPFFVELGIRK